jgi:hypothetical protein
MRADTKISADSEDTGQDYEKEKTRHESTDSDPRMSTIL